MASKCEAAFALQASAVLEVSGDESTLAAPEGLITFPALRDHVEVWQHKDPNTRLQKQFAAEYPPLQTKAAGHFEAWLLPSLFQH